MFYLQDLQGKKAKAQDRQDVGELHLLLGRTLSLGTPEILTIPFSWRSPRFGYCRSVWKHMHAPTLLFFLNCWRVGCRHEPLCPLRFPRTSSKTRYSLTKFTMHLSIKAWKFNTILYSDQIYTPRGFPGGQWLRVHLPTQGTQIQSLVWENPTGRGAAKPVHHSY